jgi:hypothetical protein
VDPRERDVLVVEPAVQMALVNAEEVGNVGDQPVRVIVLDDLTGGNRSSQLHLTILGTVAPECQLNLTSGLDVGF